MELIDRKKVLEILTPKIKPSIPYGEGYNKALEDSQDIVRFIPTVPDVNRAEIMRLCNEIEDIATEIGNYGELYKTVVAARHICDRVKAIGKELTGDAGTD